jgi:hypothetical protein
MNQLPGRHARVRRILSRALLLSTLASALLLPGAAHAAAPTVIEDVVLVIDCAVTTDDGTLRMGALVPRDREVLGDLTFWAAGLDPETDPPTYFGFPNFTLRQISPTEFGGDFFVVEPATEREFLAPIDVRLASAGPVESFSVDDRFGNTVSRQTFGTEPMSVVSGTITIDGHTFDLTGCEATRGTAEVWQTAPTATMIDGTTVDVECTWEQGGVFARLAGSHDPLETAAMLFFETEDGFWIGGGEPTLTDSEFTGTFELDGGSPGSFTIDIAFAPSGVKSSYVQVIEDTRTRVTDEVLDAAGTLTVETEGGTLVLDAADASCQTLASDFHGVRRSSNAAVADAPPNDAPADAKAIGPGGAVSVRTDGAAAEGEVRSECVKVDNEEINAFVHTAWYTWTGTGRPVTFDTAGSDFDSAVAIYVADVDGGFMEVACSDTVFLEPLGATLQGRVTFASEAGTTYYVQVGGFLTESGHLRLKVS